MSPGSAADASMRALVTGADGFVGQHLTEHLWASGDDVIEATSDICDRAALIRELADARPEVVYHLAAQADVGGSWQHPVDTFRVNVEGTLNTVDAARLCGAERVLAVSSADSYGRVAPSDLPLREDRPLRPVSPYAASKAAAEMVCLHAWLGHGFPVVTARSFNHLGPGQSDRFAVSAIAARVAVCEREGTNTVRVGALDTRRDFLDVRDVVRAYRLLVLHGCGGETYQVCSGVDHPIRGLADALVGMSPASLRFEVDPDLLRPVDLPVLRGDNSKLADATGWQPEIPIEQTLADLLGHWRRLA